jgi:hypothetical protein
MESFENTDIKMENSLAVVLMWDTWDCTPLVWGDSRRKNTSQALGERVITIMMVHVNGCKCELV